MASNTNRLLIIGGSDAGISAALRIKEIDPKAPVTVMAADALTHKGITVTLPEFAPEVLTTLDPELGALIRAELDSKGVRVVTGQAVQRISRNENMLVVHTASHETVTADMVLVAAGARPATQLAQSCTPPLSSPWDPVQMTAMQWMNRNNKAMTVEND